ncbi:hypothetical protein AK812_SmicGene29315 [Symbiodinium microadriaticum]|uniref:Uncharacterized protein n=1 Tax=Symbiodinium microadriaticum TaxID=2951 RepID=A0A1Q9D249_SYMMI|nr:hypothetical protein AK812_SmicGene29315 [Symbiodinium microadriaticum]
MSSRASAVRNIPFSWTQLGPVRAVGPSWPPVDHTTLVGHGMTVKEIDKGRAKIPSQAMQALQLGHHLNCMSNTAVDEYLPGVRPVTIYELGVLEDPAATRMQRMHEETEHNRQCQHDQAKSPVAQHTAVLFSRHPSYVSQASLNTVPSASSVSGHSMDMACRYRVPKPAYPSRAVGPDEPETPEPEDGKVVKTARTAPTNFTHLGPTAAMFCLRAASAAKQSKRRKSKLSGDSLLNLMEVGNLIRVQRKTCRHHRLWSSGDTALIRTRVSSRANSCMVWHGTKVDKRPLTAAALPEEVLDLVVIEVTDT